MVGVRNNMSTEKPKISSINLSWKDNYVRYDDTDISVDYFHGYSIGQKATCEWVKTDGADLIYVHVTNEDEQIPHLRRVKQICKIAGYTYVCTSHMHTYWGGSQGWKIEYELRRIYPSTFVVLWCGAPIGESEDFMKSVEMDEKNKDIFVEDLKANGISRIIVREFKHNE